MTENTSPILYRLVTSNNGATLTVIVDGQPRTIAETHPNFRTLRDYLMSTPNLDREKVLSLLDFAAAVGTRLEALSDRVRLNGSTLYFDGDPIEGPMVDHIVRLVKEGDEGGWRPWVNAMSKLAENPSKHSREAFYTWITGRNIQLTPDGDFIAYKAVKVVPGDGDETERFVSIHSGRAIVDNVVVDGHIPNKPGSVIEMPRSEVEHDPSIGCHTGLHAGTYDYASSFGSGHVSKLLIVKINPRDVVSVPTDCNAQKLRTCRYTVLDVVDNPLSGTTYYGEDDADYDDEDEDWDGTFYCDECGLEGDNEFDFAYDGLCHDCAQDQEMDDEDEDEDEFEPVVVAPSNQSQRENYEPPRF